jgi:photosystem II stability/assembly factor-like uncharacterized protein
MKNSVSVIMVFVVVLLVVLPLHVFSQQLIEMSVTKFQKVNDSQLLWSDIKDQSAFVLVSDPLYLNLSKLAYRVLDDDVELGKFYWLHSMDVPLFDWSKIKQSDQVTLLWNNHRTALVRYWGTDIKTIVPRQIMVQKLTFKKLTKAPVDQLHQFGGWAPDEILSVQAIVDSVNIDSIYYTERHLTGMEGIDSLQSRYSYSPQIFVAQQYLQERLQAYGYTIDLHAFGAGTFYDVAFAPGQINDGWVSGADKIYRTTDAGINWTLEYQGTSGAELWSIYPVSSQIVYAVGNYGTILKTTDGGDNWQSQISPTGTFIFGVYFLDTNNGFIAADNGIIMKTTNGGANWSIKNTPTANRLYDIVFSDASNGWAVGRSGTIVHSSDGGETWNTQSSGTSSRLYGTYFLNADTGFVVGWDGRLLKTENGGSQWTALNVSTTNYLYDIDFIDSQNGIVVGWSGTCLRTTDGGINWSQAGNLLSADAYAVDYVDNQILWSAGSGLFAQSVNGANTWQSQVSALPEGTLNNVIATKQGTTYPDRYFIICAHYDDASENPMVFAPGADDNGSGTAGVIEAARVLADYDFKYTIKFVLFSAEEQGLIGSSAYAAAAAAAGDLIEGVVNLDMIGYDSNSNGSVEIHAGTMASSQQIGTLMVNNISNWGLALTANYYTSGSSGASDHASFWSVGYPAIMQIEDWSDHTPFYHTTGDQLHTLNPSYFHENAKLAIGTMAVLAELDSISTGISVDPIAEDFVLQDPYPNPFNPTISINYYLPSNNKVEVKVFDVLGKEINTLLDSRQLSGWYTISWNATSELGNAAASGIYFIQVKAGNNLRLKKVVLLR